MAVVYHYFGKGQGYRDNLVFFLSRAFRTDIDFFFVAAGELQVELPPAPNIRCLRTENHGHDFGGYGELIATGALDAYERLIFVNCSVRGPFLPAYVTMPWTDPFLNLLAGDVHLCGATINILHADRPMSEVYMTRHPEGVSPLSHVQSYAYAMTAECFAMLREAGVYQTSRGLDKFAAIAECEIGVSQRVLARGWNISCLLPPYQGIDYRTLRADINPATKSGHPQAPGAYFGSTLRPHEVMFIKSDRYVADAEDLAFHSLMAMAHHPLPAFDWTEGRALVERLRLQLGDKLGAMI